MTSGEVRPATPLSAVRNSSALETCTASHPSERAISAWSNAAKLAATASLPIPWSTQPRAPLLNTSTAMGRSSWMAVIKAWIDMANPPSPHTATTGRSGSASLAAIAAGTA